MKDDDSNLVVAAAGSGKTTVLTTRIAYLVRTGIPAERILALTYTRAGVEAMKWHLKRDFGLENIDVRTMHSLGYELARASPKYRNGGVVKDRMKFKFMRDSLHSLSQEDRDFAQSLLLYSNAPEKPKRLSSFEDKEKYYEYLRSQKYKTLNPDDGEVKSIAERDIANFLYLNQVDYVYEEFANWADNSPDYRGYEPDFFLPNYKLYIEHWAADRNGRVPEWFTSRRHPGNPSLEYQEKKKWKLEQFKIHGRKLIETNFYEWQEGRLLDVLKEKLQLNGVKLTPLSHKEIIEQVYRAIPDLSRLEELMMTFIERAKSNGLGLEDLDSMKKKDLTPRQEAFLPVIIPIWRKYEDFLVEKKVIDYGDMINFALEVATSSKLNFEATKKMYSHILVDEFQDMTNNQIKLIRQFTLGEEAPKLFCVGDDWQNIYSFAGTNVYNLIEFDRHFPFPEQSFLSTNYRCPENIVESSNSVISLNKLKVEKKVISNSSVKCAVHLYEMPDSIPNSRYDDWEYDRAKLLLNELRSKASKHEKIMVLHRYNEPVISRLEEDILGDDRVELRTLHRAKGLQADYVLLLGCVERRKGFPSEILDHEVLEIVRTQEREDDKIEEERRLFYVGLTRCEKELYLFTSKKMESRFVKEIQLNITSFDI